MKKIIRLTESDLIRLVKRVIKEQPRILDDPGDGLTTSLPDKFKKIQNKLEDLGFKLRIDVGYDLYVFEYKSGDNFIRITINPTETNKPYSVVAVLVKPNFEPNPGYEKSKFDLTYTDLYKSYSENEINTLISDVIKSKNKIKPNV
jgi:hypothetical protein